MFVKIKVHPRAGKEKFQKVGEDHFELYVKEPAEKNLANMRVVKMMSDFFHVPHGKVRIVKGRRNPNKLVRIEI